ncbi:hypothetical protein Y032_0085g1858 [Ancylostoma ceylanicum]|uniref:Tc1-like transposase DDE domain-containing protein n=1 Tax=Ancylostoma ceylanicum TaxID=53326 RepID=A0A016TQ99_9BILA|nr:hypothetical protein Y032_0085g1858 [Ancylostoma ceylanicum]
MAKEVGIGRCSMRKIVREKLNLYPYRLQKAHALTDVMRKNRKKLCKQLLKRFAQSRFRTIVFTDEKLFTVDQVANAQNDRVLCRSITRANRKGRIVAKTAHPQCLMVWGDITSNGRTSLVFMNGGVKICRNVYKKKILEDVLKPWGDAHFGNSQRRLQQDSAPAHKAKVVQEWCKERLSNFKKHGKWPPYSPGLHPMDFSVWS